MRKNGINRELRPVEGGICAPAGFSVNAVDEVGLLFSPKRCAVACAFSEGKTQGATARVTKKNMRSGYARAVLFHGAGTGSFGIEGEKFAYALVDTLFPFGIERAETVYTSVGGVGKPLYISAFSEKIKPLYQGLGNSAEHTERARLALSQEGSAGEGIQLSYAFDLGDYPCKIGVLSTGNGATSTLLITTDVNISTAMLQRALSAEVKETVYLSSLWEPSPNDLVCALANGRAGNYPVDCEDSEYKKFKYALRALLLEVCKARLRAKGEVLACRVRGARSKEVSRSVVKSMASSLAIASLAEGRVELEGLLFAFLSVTEGDIERVELCLRSLSGSLTLFADGERLPAKREVVLALLAGEEVELVLDLKEGNYQSTAFACLQADRR